MQAFSILLSPAEENNFKYFKNNNQTIGKNSPLRNISIRILFQMVKMGTKLGTSKLEGDFSGPEILAILKTVVR